MRGDLFNEFTSEQSKLAKSQDPGTRRGLKIHLAHCHLLLIKSVMDKMTEPADSAKRNGLSYTFTLLYERLVKSEAVLAVDESIPEWLQLKIEALKKERADDEQR